MKTKNSLAQDKYGCDFDELYGGEKASITKAYNKQPKTRARAVVQAAGAVKATIGRVAHNGTKTCLMESGSTIADLVEQSGFELDEQKESIIAESTGNAVSLTSPVVHNETYAISPEIKSA